MFIIRKVKIRSHEKRLLFGDKEFREVLDTGCRRLFDRSAAHGWTWFSGATHGWSAVTWSWSLRPGFPKAR